MEPRSTGRSTREGRAASSTRVRWTGRGAARLDRRLDARDRRRRNGAGLRLRRRARRDRPDGPDDGRSRTLRARASTASTWTRRTSPRSGLTASLYVTCSGEDDRPEIVRIAPGGGTERWTHGGVELPERLPRDCPTATRSSSWRRKAERVVRVPILGRRLGRSPRSRRRAPRHGRRRASRSTPTAASGSRCTGPTGSCGSRPTATVAAWSTTISRRHLDAPTNIALVGEDLDRAVVANVGGRFLSIADSAWPATRSTTRRCRESGCASPTAT